jgi:HK97 family phage prohead protease
MPYFIEKVDSGWNTVKDDGVVLGKHKTKAEAIAQMVAVSLSEGIPVGGERAFGAGSYSPPSGVAVAAKRALQWIADGFAGAGFTDVGRARAVQLASGADVSADTVNRMKSYFARHAVDKQATGFNSGEDGYPSAGRVAWDAWGGDAGQAWVNGLSDSASTRSLGQIVISDFDDTLYVSGGLNQKVYDFIENDEGSLYVVTGRHERDRDSTVALLQRLGVSYSKLIMQPNDMQDSAMYKGDTAKALIASGEEISFVVENNAEARQAYKDAGVENVYDPASLPGESDVTQMEDRQLEGYKMTELHDKVYSLKSDALETIAKLAETVYDLCEIVDSMGEPVAVLPEVVSPDMSLPDMQVDALRFVDPLQVVELHERGERVSKGIERRELLHDLEIRAVGDGMTLRGYAAVFNSPSQPLPFIETIAPGAFRDSLNPAKRNDIKLLWNHDTSVVLGSTRAGTLRLTEDERGLLVEADLPQTQAGKDAAISIQRGDVTAFSFGFRIPAGGDEWASASERVLKRVNLHEVSVGVAFPAYTGTDGSATVRAMNELSEKILQLAELRGVSAEELTDALLALEAGDELTERQGELLTDTLGKVLKKDPAVTNPQALLDLKKKQLDLLMSRV